MCIIEVFHFDPEELMLGCANSKLSRLRVLLFTNESSSLKVEKPPPSDLGTLLGTYNGDSDQESVEPDDPEPNYDTGMEALEGGEANEPHLLEPETCGDTADEVTSDNDAASDGAADGGLDGDNDIDIVEIFDHDIDPDNLVSLPPKPAAVYKASIDGCITPAVEKLLLPPIRGCKLQRRDYPPTTTTYQAWYPVTEGPNSHCCSWGPLGVASLEEAREEVVNWCWEHYKVVVGREEAETTRILQYQRFLDASANTASSAPGQ